MSYWSSPSFKKSYAARLYRHVTATGAANKALAKALPQYSGPSGFPRQFFGRYPGYKYRRAYQYIKRSPRFRKRYMPYRKSYKRRYKPRTRYRRMNSRQKGYMRRGGYYGRYNNRSANSELKFLDQVIVAATITTAGIRSAVTPLFIPEGSGQSGRIGRKIVIKKFMMRINIDLLISTTENLHDNVRLFLVLDKQANGAHAAITDVLQTANNSSSFLNLENSHRFKVLWNRTFSMNVQAAGGNGTAIETVRNTKKLVCNLNMHVPIIYDATFTDGRISTIRSNNIMLFAISEQGNCQIGADSLLRVRYSE